MKTKYPDSLAIQQYLEGKLDPEVAHQLEKQALDDPFLWDALEGYSSFKDPAADLSILQRQLHERIVHMQENKKVFDLSWQRLSVAATAAVMFISAGILFWMNGHSPKGQMLSQSQKPVEVQVIDKDSVETIIKVKDRPVLATVTKKQSDLATTPAAESRRANPASKKAIMPPKAEEAFATSQGLTPAPEMQAQTKVSKAAAPAATAQAEAGRVQEGNRSLNGIIVTVSSPAPKSGWPAYREYLDLNIGKFKGEPVLRGTVSLSFEVLPDGKITNMKVVKGLNQAYDKEAMRIVRDGPDWTPSPGGKLIQQEITVYFGDN